MITNANKEYPRKVKSYELDELKDFKKKIQEYSKRSDNFYRLKLILAVKRGWLYLIEYLKYFFPITAISNPGQKDDKRRDKGIPFEETL